MKWIYKPLMFFAIMLGWTALLLLAVFLFPKSTLAGIICFFVFLWFLCKIDDIYEDSPDWQKNKFNFPKRFYKNLVLFLVMLLIVVVISYYFQDNLFQGNFFNHEGDCFRFPLDPIDRCN